MSHARRRKPDARLRCETLEDRITPATAFALIPTTNSLISFDTANAALVNPPLAVSGLGTGENLVGIDFRPQNGMLYGLATAPSSQVRLYAISQRTGVATPLTATPVGFSNLVGGVPAPIPITGVNFGFDFNPSVDRIRVTTDTGFNFRINPNTGALVDSNNDGTNGIQPDAAINTAAAGTFTVDGTAYTNNTQNFITNAGTPAPTTQYTLDSTGNRLFIQTPPNSGTQTMGQVVMLGGAVLDFTGVNGFDIPAGVDVATSGTAATGSGFASLTTATGTRLYSINLTTGAATDLGPIGGGTVPYNGLAIQSVQGAGAGGLPAVGFLNVTGFGTQALLTRFNTGDPAGRSANTLIAGGTNNEVLVGIDYRPATGQLFGLGINEGTNTGTLYLIDPQFGPSGTPTATVIGTSGGIAFQDAAGTAVDLPAFTAGYGFDFNPTVDRIRVTTGTGLNFRLNPNDGAPVDGNLGGAAGSVTNINTDANITGPAGAPATGIEAVAYTNSFGTGGTPATPAGVTTQYTLSALTNTLYIQTPPNSGTQTAPLAVTLNGAALDFTAVSGFDIPAGVRDDVNGTGVPSGFGFAALTVAGATGLYRIDLTTGAATNLGSLDIGGQAAISFSGLAVGDAPVGTVAFTTAAFGGTEGGSAAITLTRTGGTVGSFAVTVTATGGNATAGTDFTSGPYTVTFADGATTATLTIPIANDALTEGNETTVLTLSASNNASVRGAQSTAILTITDVPPAPMPTPTPTPTPTPIPLPMPDPVIAIATGSDGTVQLYRQNEATPRTFTPYVNYSGTVTVAVGDVNGDGVDDVITGSGTGATHVKVFDGVSGTEIRSFIAYVGGVGGVNVGAGDIDGDGFADILTGASVNGHVKAFSGLNGAEIRSFLAYSGFTGAVTVAGADIDGDGRDDIITGASVNGHVKAFSGTNTAEIRSFFAYSGFTGAATVAGGDIDNDGRADIITGASVNGHVKAFRSADLAAIRSFFAFERDGLNGVFVG